MTTSPQRQQWLSELHLWLTTSALLLVLGLTPGVTQVQAQTLTTIYSFTGGTDGGGPDAGVIPDRLGNLYGTTYNGGTYDRGVVFKIDSAGNETVLHSFAGGTTDGCVSTAGLFRDESGNLYGTTSDCGTSGYGTVFKVGKDGHETVLYSFQGGSDGMYPYGGVIRDRYGNLYGTTIFGGSSGGYGTVFRTSKNGKETLLHSFAYTDGAYPQYGKLVMDKAGNLYGLTSEGGSYLNGVVYRLSKQGQFTVLFGFGYDCNGSDPQGKPWVDNLGNVYGTTRDYSCGYGTVWKVTKTGTETTLHTFDGSDGAWPLAGVDRDSKGNLYGDTTDGGAYGYGTVYQLSPSGTLTLLHTFSGKDGEYPDGGLVLNANGSLYGTANEGGRYGYGTVWVLSP